LSDLTPKHHRFIDEYLIDCNAKQAAIRAGYSAKTAEVQGSRLLSYAKVSQEIQRRQADLAQNAGITVKRVLEEYARIAFADIGEFLRITEDGRVELDFTRLREGDTRIISEITQDEIKEGRGKDTRTIVRTKFKLHPKLTALDAIGKHIGMFKASEDDRPAVAIAFSINVGEAARNG
jgi:phage terminase small subunit